MKTVKELQINDNQSVVFEPSGAETIIEEFYPKMAPYGPVRVYTAPEGTKAVVTTHVATGSNYTKTVVFG